MRQDNSKRNANFTPVLPHVIFKGVNIALSLYSRYLGSRQIVSSFAYSFTNGVSLPVGSAAPNRIFGGEVAYSSYLGFVLFIVRQLPCSRCFILEPDRERRPGHARLHFAGRDFPPRATCYRSSQSGFSRGRWNARRWKFEQTPEHVVVVFSELAVLFDISIHCVADPDITHIRSPGVSNYPPSSENLCQRKSALSSTELPS